MTSGDRPVESERLAAALRELRAGTGLSMAALAAKTPYSKSSWERYLNGKALPPRQAVVVLCELAGEPRARPLALWELADAAWSGRAAGGTPPPAPPPEPVAPSPPPGDAGGPRRLIAVVAGVPAALGIAVSLLVTGALTPGSADGTRAPGGGGPPSPTVRTTGCHGSSCTGKNPEEYGCGAAPPPTTLRRHGFPGRTVIKIRHGTVCGAVWARIDLGNVGDRVEIRVPHRAPRRTEVKDEYDAEGSLTTPMVAAGRGDLDRVRACLVRGGERYCFGTGGADREE
ncbi:helix-turn-helix domain-containing protein [Streptomyces poonensis]|uniref:HTH cro/C1-type domain-containing protein n=1 Tax=Streptomyces poonensis TaxID=68255 RepID=A0A918UKZ2_9ACTN|nr:XRE family transcriptional regulator [Streptomyces poonensis]GGZ17527.1 hypothetical protein GCM10010365_41700 [Streptomyces poonensis]GLJ90952.1 hypothetical protein GCM10017589_35580 [Streptomyces poonensis]